MVCVYIAQRSSVDKFGWNEHLKSICCSEVPIIVHREDVDVKCDICMSNAVGGWLCVYWLEVATHRFVGLKTVSSSSWSGSPTSFFSSKYLFVIGASSMNSC